MAQGKLGVPASGWARRGTFQTDIRLRAWLERGTPMSAIFFEQLVGVDEPPNDPSSIFFFRDHLTYLFAQVTRPLSTSTMGLLEVARQPREEAARVRRRQGRQSSTASSAEASRPDGRA